MITPMTVTASHQITHTSVQHTKPERSCDEAQRSRQITQIEHCKYTEPVKAALHLSAPMAPEAVCCSRCDSARAYALKRPSLFHLIIALPAPTQSLRRLALPSYTLSVSDKVCLWVQSLSVALMPAHVCSMLPAWAGDA